MRTTKRFGIASGSFNAGFLGTVRRHFFGNPGRTVALLLLLAAACGSAKAQYIGYAANSTDGTVSVFAVATSGPTFGNEVSPGNQDHLIATVQVGKTPVRIAVTPSPNFTRAYVTNQGDNSLWVIDVTKISQEGISPGSITAQNVNSTSDPLQLFQPGGIAIANVTTGANTGHVFAFVANQGNNTVSIVDTKNNTLFGIVTLGSSGTSTTVPEVALTPDGAQVFVTNNSTANCNPASSTPCAGIWLINATSVTNGTIATKIPAFGSLGLRVTTQAASLSSNVATLTMSSTTLGFTAGSTIQVSGFTGADTYFNGLFTIASVSSRQITYNDTHANGVASTNGTVTAGLVPVSPRGIATLQATVSGSVHTILGIADSAAHTVSFPPYQPIDGYIFFLDLTVGSGAAIEIPGGRAPSSPISISAFCVPSVSPCAAGSILNAEVLDPVLPGVWLFSGTAAALLSGDVIRLLLTTGAPPSSLAVTPDGHFSYVAEPLSLTPIQLIENLISSGSSFGFADGSSFGNKSSIAALGNGPTGLAISSLDPSSPPVVWFIPQVSGGFAPPSGPLAVGASLSVSGESMVGVVGQSVQTTLNFGAGTSCSIFDTSKGSSGTTCAANATNGANGIGGSTTFPASGVFTLSLTGTSNGSSGFAKELVTVGANCTWSLPSSVTVDVAVSATLSCTAPGTDNLQATINWGDGTPTQTVSGPANSLSFSAHMYMSPNPNGYNVTVTVTDTTAKTPGSVVPSSATIVVTIAPTLNPGLTSTTIAPGQSVVFPVSLNGGSSNKGVSFAVSCAVSPAGGPACLVSPLTVVLDGNGNGTVQVTVTDGSVTAIVVAPNGQYRAALLASLIALTGLTLAFLTAGMWQRRTPKRAQWGLALLVFAVLIMLSTGACTNVQPSTIASAPVCTGCANPGSYIGTVTAKSVSVTPQLISTPMVFTLVVVPN